MQKINTGPQRPSHRAHRGGHKRCPNTALWLCGAICTVHIPTHTSPTVRRDGAVVAGSHARHEGGLHQPRGRRQRQR